MNEITKTSIYIAIAVVLFLFAWLVQPRERAAVTDDVIGRALLENFKDPSQIKELQIVKYLPESGDLVDFRVAEIGGKWCLPSHQNYPADADEQMGRVAAGLIDQKVLDITFKDDASADVRKIHETFGVLDPASNSLGSGDSVGVKVIMTGENKRPLVSLIIGKDVENTNGMHSYVRVPEQNTVYVMAVNKDNLSTKFDDWIEKNLLDISSFDLKSVRMQDYSTDVIETDQGMLMVPIFHSYYKVAYDAMSLGDKWQLEVLRRKDPQTQQSVSVTLALEESLNEKKLEVMRQAFDDLKIIDVLKKPESIASAQRAGEAFGRSDADIDVLQSIGYMLQADETADGTVAYRMYSRQGGTAIEMNDGIVYNLMFGNLTGTNIAENANVSSNAPAGIDVAADDTADSDAGSTVTGSSAATNVLSANRYLMVMAEFDPSIIEKPAPLPLPEIPVEGDEAEIAKLKEQLAAAELANKRLEDEYNNAIEAGQRRAKELNQRFADWFFVISDDVFKKVHVPDNDLITKPGAMLPNPGRDAALDQMIAPFQESVETPANESQNEQQENLPTENVEPIAPTETTDDTEPNI